MLSGAYASSVSWILRCLEIWQSHGLDLIPYDKYGASPISEGSTGADFSLLIRFSDEFARVSVFQAKVSDSIDEVDVHRIAPFRAASKKAPEKLPEPQALRLVEYGLSLIASKNEDDLNWIHFCAYAPNSFFCIPLSQALTLITSYRGTQAAITKDLQDFRKEKSGENNLSTLLRNKARQLYGTRKTTILRRDSHTLELIHLLAAGASIKPDLKAPGWLNLNSAAEIKNFKDTCPQEVQLIELSGSPSPSPSPSLEIVGNLNQAAKCYTTEINFNPIPTPGAGSSPKLGR
ncbi:MULTISPECIES: hypothetical protein [Xanthomonas]|uniref:hypothetical protein n=1 Tax=Xanthomonas TaxID=338 RepID=UPI0011C40626|nr:MULTISPECIES: hypothetical protein [Xanthomonas]CAD1789472.1 hypothetical protein XSP_001296 [Xanthomonas sp. CPBF 426]CAG2086898.1 hypothetical protein XCY_001260 [Xanthomonas euroxanthea]